MERQNDDGEDLPLPPPVVPSNVAPIKIEKEIPKKKRIPIARIGFAKKGQPINLLTNHFRVSVSNVDKDFYHYSVNLKYEDDRPAEGKGIGRKVIDKMQQTYDTELGGRRLAYDGEKTLFTIGELPQKKSEFVVILDDLHSKRPTTNGSPGGNDSPGDGERKRVKRSYNAKTIKVELSYAARIPMQSIGLAIKGQENENTQEALRVLDIILRQHASRQGCLLVRQSFFHDKPSNFVDLGGGVIGCRGTHSSFRPAQNGLSLNIDMSTTMIVRPGPVVDFLIANQNCSDPFHIDWTKAKRMLKNLRVKVGNQEYKIVGLSDLPCNQQMFTLKQRGDLADIPLEITVYEYFVKHRGIQLSFSAGLPCINVGKPKRPTYFPIELCNLVSLQRYTKSLTVIQRSSLVEKSRQKPQERMKSLSDALKCSNYESDQLLKDCGITINSSFTQVDGRVLQAPKLKVGNGEDFFPRNGRWNFNNKKLMTPVHIERWAVVNFSARCDMNSLLRDLSKCGNMKGIRVDDPFDVFDENPSMRRATATSRVDAMFEQVQSRLPGEPKFLLCLLPERKNSDIYGPWKRKCLSDFGIVTQCIAPTRVNDQYLTNVLLKINAKLGGLNSQLQVENTPLIPVISKAPTIILGMDVSHGSPGRADVPSIAAVVSSRQWPLISKYRASVRTQSSKVEMMDSLFKPANGKEDNGIIRELLIDFYMSSGKRKPEQIIIFRDGVSESQFNQVLNIELDQIIEACKFLDDQWSPKFTLIIAQKNHHTKFFQTGNCPDNVPPGTVVDKAVCHPKNYDFYMCSHAGMIGTTRPTHYHVLLDENHFSADDLQELVHSLSYVYQRSTTAISVVAPICYAHLAAAQVGQFVKFEDRSETSSSQGGFTAPGAAAVPELPRLHDNVSSSMFFC